MSGIGFPREADAELYDLYSRKLLIPGWSGEVSEAEAAYIAEKLTKSPKLRRSWGVRQYFGKRRRKISPDMAKRLCAAWCRNPALGVKEPSTASGKKGERQTVTKLSGKGAQLPLL